MKEKIIEKGIRGFLIRIGAVVESMQGGSSITHYKNKFYKINHQTKGCPDIICFYKNFFIGIEVKKNQEEVNKWIKNIERLKREGFLPNSLKRDEAQIKYRDKILNNGGFFIITCDLEEVIDFFDSITKNKCLKK